MLSGIYAEGAEALVGVKLLMSQHESKTWNQAVSTDTVLFSLACSLKRKSVSLKNV